MLLVENVIIGGIGSIVGFILLYVNRRASKSLVGSFFKNYYDLSMIAITLLVVSFVIEFFLVFGVEQEIVNMAHHALLIIAGVVFVFTSIALPKEAVKYMDKRAEEDKQ